ncbi:heme exporter protein CcmB [Marinobacter xestospongiae]|uniref:Heme exporter protein B n=2 Tax=Marinobacter xestospongiae TaxID=994319 RepID=A0ABU3VTJ6_9GAMM|nr:MULTISPECIES: heme exporter protein CcmB [Marinobacter]MCG8516722.1 heme exporter protein CcmB [Pseudomonadales bacterium]MCK7566586.1 heme exporter protein CcmB [Marinobacter xestospongiae]MDV2077590.1 heme exporter protein CcmB [Marinobacter xestospongiae]
MWTVVRRDLKSSFRQRQDLLNPLLFFFMVVTLFPLGVSPEVSFLQRSGSGILWVAALLATLLSLDHLFRHDFDDGTLEQMVLQPQPLFLLVLAKTLAHWLVTGLPLILLAPVLGIMLHLEGNSIAVLCLTLLIGTPVLSLIGAIGAALTLGLRAGGVLLSLLIIPLYIPVLIFGTGTVAAAADGTPVGGYLALMAAFLVLAITLAPFAAAAALRISLSNS